MARAVVIHVLLLFLYGITGCRYHNEEELYGPSDAKCDTVNITLSNSINQILTLNCYSCHSSSNAGPLGAGINLQTYSELRTIALSGRLAGAITHSSGFVPMPLNGTKLDDCSIEKIKAWIKNGALNN
jgi:hypothetical protein